MKSFLEATDSVIDTYFVGTEEQRKYINEFDSDAKGNRQFMRFVFSLTQSLLNEVKSEDGQKIVNKGAQSVWRAAMIGLAIGREMEKQDIEAIK